MNPFLRYLADKNSAHRHTPWITRPCGLRRAGNNKADFSAEILNVFNVQHVLTIVTDSIMKGLRKPP